MAQELDAEAAQRRSELEQTKQRIASLETQARLIASRVSAAACAQDVRRTAAVAVRH